MRTPNDRARYCRDRRRCLWHGHGGHSGRERAGDIVGAADRLGRSGRQNPRLPDVTLPENIIVTDDPDAALADIVLLALPAQALRGFLAEHGAALDGRALISCAKGIDLDTLTGPATLIADACPAATVGVLTGPSFAADIARGLPTALTLACADPDAGERLQHALATPTLGFTAPPMSPGPSWAAP